MITEQASHYPPERSWQTSGSLTIRQPARAGATSVAGWVPLERLDNQMRPMTTVTRCARRYRLLPRNPAHSMAVSWQHESPSSDPATSRVSGKQPPIRPYPGQEQLPCCPMASAETGQLRLPRAKYVGEASPRAIRATTVDAGGSYRLLVDLVLAPLILRCSTVLQHHDLRRCDDPCRTRGMRQMSMTGQGYESSARKRVGGIAFAGCFPRFA
jgi:hypothetical protein